MACKVIMGGALHASPVAHGHGIRAVLTPAMAEAARSSTIASSFSFPAIIAGTWDVGGSSLALLQASIGRGS